MSTSVFNAKEAGLNTRVLPNESDDSCLSDSGGSDDECVPKTGYHNSSSDITDNSSDEDSDGHKGQAVLPSNSLLAARKKSAAGPKRKRRKVVWETVDPSQYSAKHVPTWEASLPESETIRSPIEYFRDFFDAELLDVIVEYSNLYCNHQNPFYDLKFDRNELEQFIGTLVYMSILRLPRSRMYWSNMCRVQQVADVMTRERWNELKNFLHFSDNSAPNNSDRLFKIRSLIDFLLPKFQALPQDQMLSVDEQIVPFKGRTSLKQCISKKLYKWGYKIFVLRDSKGLVHSFDIFTGKTDPAPGEEDIGESGNIVLKLAQVIDGSVNHLLYFDKWFSSVDLFVALANKGILALGALQPNSLQGCSFSTDIEMKEGGRGTFEEQQTVVDEVEIRAVKWFDKRSVMVASTFASAQPVIKTEKWDRKLKNTVCVECPSIVALYNQFMGGIDGLDALIAYYRIHIRTRKYYHRFFFHFVDMVIANSWLLYRRDCESMEFLQKKQMDFVTFRTSIAHALCMQGKDLSKKRGLPSSDVEREYQKKKRRGPAKAIPTPEIRSDAVGHWPVVDNGRQRCKFPICNKHTVFKCVKCDVHLCLNKHNNCFRAFHE
ncbi:piggyBac transposable element-derived protein 2-like [Sphaeramia orbicularis]|uniref:PiggyBac transposable element-derived protein 2-like n=1 Tax=Sphaeramia orbicularis TaxID=375764 RepID=A0A673A929_9TELE|nr:piggyBac transposable element-derived protein 2-like [Sphaeramia orbicularis]